jgi:hypothetical protein
MPVGYQLKNICEDKRYATLSVYAGALPRQAVAFLIPHKPSYVRFLSCHILLVSAVF